MVDRKVARKLSSDAVNEHRGPVHYVCHHEVMKPESNTTPCRIVFDSSARFRGHSLNDYWAKGPTLLNSLIGVLLRFRERPVAMTGDIRKMYNAIRISELDQHTHRFLWRNMSRTEMPSIYAITAVSFGDKPAGNIAMIALRKTVEMYRDKYPHVEDIIKSNTYVNDILDSFESHNQAIEVAQDIDSVINVGGFKVKEWLVSSNAESIELQDKGDKREIQLDDANEKELGMTWHRKQDAFSYTAKVNFSPKRRNVRIGPDLRVEQLSTNMTVRLTKRMILSQVNGIFDPLGLASPFTIKAKMLMRKLWMHEAKDLGWDDPLPANCSMDWINFFTEIFEMETFKFKRCIRPNNAIGDPVLVTMSDGAEEAYGACAYGR